MGTVVGSKNLIGIVAEVTIREVSGRYTSLRTLLLDDDGRVNPAVVVFRNDQQLSGDQLGLALAEDDKINLVPAIEGG